jgi:hypothetical protein
MVECSEFYRDVRSLRQFYSAYLSSPTDTSACVLIRQSAPVDLHLLKNFVEVLTVPKGSHVRCLFDNGEWSVVKSPEKLRVLSLASTIDRVSAEARLITERIQSLFTIPRIDDLLDAVSGSKYFTSLDLTSGYHQILISEEDRPKTAFRTPIGHFQFKELIEGLTNALATFQTAMNSIFHP